MEVDMLLLGPEAAPKVKKKPHRRSPTNKSELLGSFLGKASPTGLLLSSMDDLKEPSAGYEMIRMHRHREHRVDYMEWPQPVEVLPGRYGPAKSPLAGGGDSGVDPPTIKSATGVSAVS